MSKLNTQFGVTVTSDFSEGTWTFEMPKKFGVSAGEFAILPKDKYERLITAIKGIRNSMNIHPDCTDESEFADMVNRCDESIEEVGS